MSSFRNLEQEVKHILPGGCTCGNGEDVQKGYRRVNMVEILCTHVRKWKKETC
jgi:hypothetical protein